MWGQSTTMRLCPARTPPLMVRCILPCLAACTCACTSAVPPALAQVLEIQSHFRRTAVELSVLACDCLGLAPPAASTPCARTLSPAASPAPMPSPPSLTLRLPSGLQPPSVSPATPTPAEPASPLPMEAAKLGADIGTPAPTGNACAADNNTRRSRANFTERFLAIMFPRMHDLCA